VRAESLSEGLPLIVDPRIYLFEVFSSGRAQRRGRSVADARPLALRPEKPEELFAPSDCSEWLSGEDAT
jgi:hypothetical protein